MSKNAEKAKKIGEKVGETIGKAAGKVVGKGKETADEVAEKVFNALDINGDGQIDIEDLIEKSLESPSVKINRNTFLRKEFKKYYSENEINDAIAFNPAHAGMPIEEIDKIADAVILTERLKVSGISAALGVPGGAFMAATIPADIVQYFGCMLRVAQKLMYLYGFPQIDTKEKDAQLDAGTMNTLIICLGVMQGVAGANNALKAMAKALAAGVEKQLLKAALTKGTIYPIVKKVAAWFGAKMTKEVFAGFFKKAIPVVGGFIGGGLTWAVFKPNCERLKKSLRDTKLTNPNRPDSSDEEIDQTVIDAEFEVKE